MEIKDKKIITVETTVKVPVAKVWEYWTTPKHIKGWNAASDDWHTTYAENDLRVGGKFLSRMEAKDGNSGFDFGGVYDKISENDFLNYTIGDGRKVEITFSGDENETTIIETFETEDTHAIEMQKGGWQAILDNFKKYSEAHCIKNIEN